MIAAQSSTLSPQPGQDPSRARSISSVVIATIARPVGETGVQTHTQTLLTGLEAAGIRPVLQTPFSGSRKWLAVFAARPFILNRINRTWATRWHRHWHETALREILEMQFRRQTPDVVLAQCPVSARAALDARAAMGGEFPVVMVCHFNYSEATEWRDRGELADGRHFSAILASEKSVLEAVDQVVYVSSWARRVVEEERGIRPLSSKVIWNGIAPGRTGPRLSRRELGFDEHDLLLVNVGTLERRKNQLALVELFGRLVNDSPNAKLLLVGDGRDRGVIENRIHQLQLTGKVRLLGFRHDVAAVLSACDAYLHAALLENCPMSVLEAARAGLPIAAAPTGGTAELLSALGGTSLDLANIDAAVRIVKPLLAAPKARASAGQLARRSFEQHFTSDAMLQKYLETFDELAAAKGAAR